MNEQFDFSKALLLLKNGERVQRSGWNGKGMWLMYVFGHTNETSDDEDGEGITTRHIDELPGDMELLPWIGMKTADNKFVPWLASQTDILADDWQIFQEAKNSEPSDFIDKERLDSHTV